MQEPLALQRAEIQGGNDFDAGVIMDLLAAQGTAERKAPGAAQVRTRPEQTALDCDQALVRCDEAPAEHALR